MNCKPIVRFSNIGVKSATIEADSYIYLAWRRPLAIGAKWISTQIYNKIDSRFEQMPCFTARSSQPLDPTI
ncbi:uncharacterized protein METZ01_LOCUS239704 [marine metagenome]|uniref:Uncharacterized protein n=1 Tax=marine metagenome TaxID=408172 RepID=A0A382HHS4_9ZZZZ